MSSNKEASEKLRREIDSAAGAVRHAKAIGSELAANAVAQIAHLHELTGKIAELRQLIGNDVPELAKLQRRVDRIYELQNMQELGSFQLEIDRVMEAAWRALP